jgi:hypothetical protein
VGRRAGRRLRGREQGRRQLTTDIAAGRPA